MKRNTNSTKHGDDPHSQGGGISQHSRDHLRHQVDHMCHMLSEQGPMSITFVHNNTLLGLQKHHFEEAIEKSKDYLGGRGYLENSEYRDHYWNGRITDADIDYIMGRRKDLHLDRILAGKKGRNAINSGTLLRVHLVHGINAKSAAELRFAAKEENATRRFRADLPREAREALLASSAAELEQVKQRIGVDLTMADWLGEQYNLDIVGHVRREVAGGLADGRRASGPATAQLRAFGIPADRWPGYQALVQKLLGKIPADQAEQAVNLWLRAEMEAVSRLARRYFDIDGAFDELFNYFKSHLAEYAASGMWAASLKHLGLADPFSTLDGSSLQERDAWSVAAETLAEQHHYMERWGGPPVQLDAELRAQVAGLVRGELAKLEDAKIGSGAVERAQLCWIVLHDLGEAKLNRRGFEALKALLSLAENAEHNEVLSRIELRDPRQAMQRFAEQSLAKEIASLTSGQSHADFIQSLTGENMLERVNDYMIGLCSAFMDEGLAAWHLPGRALGFYESWRNLVHHDRTFDFDGLAGWRDAVHHLPVMAVDAVITQLQELGIPEANWHHYCGRLLVNLKGWAGMVFWRQNHPNYAKQQAFPIDVMQYLAVRLFYQNQIVVRSCRNNWQLHPGIENLMQYFTAHPAEYMVRKLLHTGQLPDYLAEQARSLAAAGSSAGRGETDRWKNLADMAWMYRESEAPVRDAADRAWRLFQSAQFLGLDVEKLRGLSSRNVDALLSCLDGYPEESHGPVWLHAFELNYRDEVLNAMALNRGRGRWMKRNKSPKSQVVFCIDEREESIHRHYEELDPGHETLGAAGFFGVAMNYQGLDDHKVTPLCPAVVTPAHKVVEVARPIDEHVKLPAHQRRGKWLEVFHDTFWEMKRNVAGSYFLIDAAGFLTAYPLIGRIFFPVKYFAGVHAVKKMFVPEVKTRLAVTREDTAGAVGFTLTEQADRCEGLLRNIGLISNFAPMVVFCAHGSNSQNNPHENAHDCGACGGKHGFANSRALAAMCNTPAVRELLRQRGLIIPDDTWFVGAIHNTASDIISFFDEDDVPKQLRAQFSNMARDLVESSMRAARERCRRFASAPKDASIEASYHHVQGRAYDFSQVRPEWGHATNAFAVVGRRGITQGVFFDRRPFIISYDPSTDPTGKILERILMAVGPVGAGINLEYYFSTVDTKVYGSDTKVPHNVTGLVGIMEGAHSDLRTGLPRQMTEVHEAMRLNLVVDAPMAILGEIYGRQPAIQELLNGEWVILIAHDPETGEFNQFVPGVGFEKWDDSKLEPIPSAPDSYAWFKGKYEKFLPPALIAEPARAWKN
jgi:uncharacterized protein YbcC (UPF0753/DUF2309 family)